MIGLRFQIPSWCLKYQVASIGVYATTLVEGTYLVLGGFGNATPLAISLLTNASAIGLAGLGGSNAVPVATFRMCATSLFLLGSMVIVHEGETYNGTYAALCSLALLIYNSLLLYDENQRSLQEDKKRTEDSMQQENLPFSFNGAASPYRNLILQYRDSVRVDCGVLLLFTLGTVMTYRVFDFDLGFGLVFASVSAVLCIGIILCSGYLVKTRERILDINKPLLMLIRLLVMIGCPVFGFFCAYNQLFDAEDNDAPLSFIGDLSWWRVSFGVSWCVSKPLHFSFHDRILMILLGSSSC